MLIKNLNLLTSLLLLSLFSTISINAAKANNEETKELRDSSDLSAEQEPYILSQSLGHKEYLGEPQMSWNDYQTGTIVGKHGSTLSVVTEDGTLIHHRNELPGEIGELAVGRVGESVLIVEEDGKKVVLEEAHPAWVGTLQQDYGFSKENDYRSNPPLEARTAPLWQSLGVSR